MTPDQSGHFIGRTDIADWHSVSLDDTRSVVVIKSFRHDGIERFFRSGFKAGIQSKHAKRLRLQLGRLDAATEPADMNLPGWRWHPLAGARAGHWTLWVDENFRLTFAFEGVDAVLVDYRDYH